MRTTLDLPQELVAKAMEITQAKTKTDLIKLALENIIRTEKVSKLVKYHGKVNLEIDLDDLRKR